MFKDENPEQKIHELINSLFNTGAFYYYLTLKMFTITYVDELPHGSPAATDGYNLYVTEKFFEKYDNQSMLLILAHEAVHAMYRHVARGMGRNPLVWNFAADATVNRYVTEDFKDIIPNAAEKMREMGLVTDESLSEMFDLDKNVVKNQTAEEIYNELISKANQNKRQQMDKELKIKDMEDGEEIRESESSGKGIPSKAGLGGKPSKVLQRGEPSSGGENKIGPDLTKGELSDELKKARGEDQIREAIKRVTERIRSQAKQLQERYAGKGGGSFTEEIIPSKPKLNFNFLRISLDRWYQGDVVQSYRRYNRRFIMLPSTAYVGKGQVYVLLDVSGSISPEELSQAAGEINQLARRYGQVEIYQWDSGVRSALNVTNNINSLKIYGRGGTELAPAVRQIAEQKRLYFPQQTKPAFIIFSDFELADERQAVQELQRIARNVFLIQVSYTGKFIDVIPSTNIKV